VPGVGLTYSTADNSQPPQVAPQRVTTVRMGVLLGMFGAEQRPRFASDTADAGISTFEYWTPRVGVYQALLEINNKTDGVADDLLPHTSLLFAYRDDNCDSNSGLAGALQLTRNAFNGEGVDVIIGAGCSLASMPAAQVAGLQDTPIVSPSSFSPTLSDGENFPFFLRTTPSDDFYAVAMVDVLQSLFNYTSAALVSSTDAYGAGSAAAFTATSLNQGLTISASVTFGMGADDFGPQHRELQRSGARVIVIFTGIPSDSANFIRLGLDVGVGGEGCESPAFELRSRCGATLL
jgi:ABC-type branched-subunit amino acid transport system substrate-binding protein